MPYFNDSMLAEIGNLTVNDKEKLIAAIHWAIAEEEPRLTIELTSYRDGDELIIGSYDYKEVYDFVSGQ